MTLSGQAGTCTITAHQAGNETYNAAADVARLFSVLSSAVLCTDPQPPSVTDQSVHQPTSMAEPAARTPFQDPVFGTCVVRVTDRNSDIDASDSSAGMKNEYSRVQSFNADESRILVRGVEATWYLYDAGSLQPLGILGFGGSVDPRWDATSPQLLHYTDWTQLISYNVQNGSRAVVHDFATDFPGQSLGAVWMRYEGSPSQDGRYWGLMAENDPEFRAIAFLVYDLQMDQVIAKRDLPSQPEVDSVTISPLGAYFLAYYDNYCEHGQLGTDANPCGLMVYDGKSLQNGRGLLRIIGHSDVALDAQGREVLIYQGIDTDSIDMLDLATGQVTALWPIDFSHQRGIGFHFSGRSFNRPGWALVSTYNGSDPASWMDDQVFAVEFKANGRIARLAHTHSLYDESVEQDYWAEPQASVNRDFTRVLFTTNWGRTGTEAIEMYMVELPSDWMK